MCLVSTARCDLEDHVLRGPLRRTRQSPPLPVSAESVIGAGSRTKHGSDFRARDRAILVGIIGRQESLNLGIVDALMYRQSFRGGDRTILVRVVFGEQSRLEILNQSRTGGGQ